MKTLALILLSAALCGCMSDREVNRMVNRAHLFDLTLPSQMYRDEKGRWPKDYSELSAFVQQSAAASSMARNFASHYEHAELIVLPDDTLQIHAVGDGWTNCIVMRYDAITQQYESRQQQPQITGANRGQR